MKFAIINDTHVGPANEGYYKGIQRKLTQESERLINEFVSRMNNQEHPEFVVNLGDSIEDVNDRNIDVQSFKKTITLLSKLKVPVYFLVGNHDVRTLTQKEIAKMFGYENMYYSFDHGSYHFIVLSFELTGDHTHVLGDIHAEIPKEQIDWLKDDLFKTNKPALVFVHYGLAEDDMKGNFWFENAPEKALIGNRAQVRKILEESGKVKAVFSAHQHWNRMFVHNGIPYFTVTSLVENFNNDGVPAEAHTIVILEKDKVAVDVRGSDPANLNLVGRGNRARAGLTLSNWTVAQTCLPACVSASCYASLKGTYSVFFSFKVLKTLGLTVKHHSSVFRYFTRSISNFLESNTFNPGLCSRFSYA